MIVVSDTTPLNYLLLVGAIDVLPALFKQVIAPPAVFDELQDPRTPQLVRRWMQAPPVWLLNRTPSHTPDAARSLDRGEAEAIALAIELNASVILIDDRKAVTVAQRQGLTVVRTLALLELASERNLIDLSSTLRKLQSTTFRISQQYLDAALQREALRKAQHQPPA